MNDGTARRGRVVSRSPASRDKTTRLVRLLLLLLGGPASRDTIREELGSYYGPSAEKAVRRDLRQLQDALPEPARLAFRARRGVVAIERLPLQISFSQEELQALAQIAETFAVDLPHAAAVRALVARLLDGSSGRASRTALHLRPALATSYAAHAGTIEMLERAINAGQSVAFSYRAMGKEQREHPHVEPAGMFVQSGHLYLEGYSQESQRFIDYRVDRIIGGSVRILPAYHGEPRPRQLVRVRFRLLPPLAGEEISLRLAEQRIVERRADGSAVIEGKARSLFEAERLLLGYGPLAEALAPAELRGRLAKAVREMAKIYPQ